MLSWFCADLPGFVLPLRYPITLDTVLKDAWFSMVRFMIFLAEEQTEISKELVRGMKY